MFDVAKLQTLAAAALKRARGLEMVSLQTISAGGNNRVFKVTCTSGEVFLLKAYYRNSSDPRDRLSNEFGAITFMKKHGVAHIPEAILADRPGFFAFYEYVDGENISGPVSSDNQIRQAAEFLSKLKDLSQLKDAISLPPASEACYSFSKVVVSVEERLSRFVSLTANDDLDGQLRLFLNENFRAAMTEVTAWARGYLKSKGVNADSEISGEQRTLSPSDFGFHNALSKPGGELVFIDFEYFGWDDPVKMISDFLFHPGMSLDDRRRKIFLEAIVPTFEIDPEFFARLGALYPLFGLKWCLIVLNEFLPGEMGRRRFAQGIEVDRDRARAAQLNKARHLLDRVRQEYEIFPKAFIV